MAIETIKFSQMTNAGDIENNDVTPSLRLGENVVLDNPWTFLRPGTTAERPPITPAIYNRLRYNTTLLGYEYYLPELGDWVQLDIDVNIQSAPFVSYTSSPLLFNAFDLGTLSNGILKQTVLSGVSTPAIAINGTDYYGPGVSTYLQAPLGFADVNGNPTLHVNTVGALAVNYSAFTNAIASGEVIFSSEGSDVNIPIRISPKGTGFLYLTDFRWMTADGVPNSVVQTDGSGNLSFTSTAITTGIIGTEFQVLANGTFGIPQTGVVTLTLPQDIAPSSTPEFTDLILNGGAIYDGLGAINLQLDSPVDAVNYPILTSGQVANPVSISVDGSDTDISIFYSSKGSGIHSFISLSNSPFEFNSGTSSQHKTIFEFADTANNRTVTWQDADGTVAYLSDIPTPSPLTRVDDTNVTVTLGGNPATALIQPVSLTMGWTGQLGLTRGGTASSLVASNGGIVWSNASSLQILSGTATANLPLLSGSSASPQWGSFALSLGGVLTTAGAHILSGAFSSTFTFTNTTSVTFPTSGTLATTSQLPTPAALTKTDDTNVTLILGGTPATALLQATSLTLGWTGQLGLTRGGTNASLTASNGGVVFSGSSALQILSGTATAGQMLRSGASSVGSWSTNTWPNTTAINSLLYASAANVISNLAPSNNGILSTDATGFPFWLTSGTSYTPTITFFVPGDLSVVYTNQLGTYWRIANIVLVRITLAFTPTYTTAGSGALISLPLTVATNGNIGGAFYTVEGASSNHLTYPVGCTKIDPVAAPSSTNLFLAASGSAASTTTLSTTHIPTAVSQEFSIFLLYMV